MKNLFALLLTILLPGALSAQSFNLGLKGGLNSYTLTNTGWASSKASFHAGLLGNFSFGNNWAIQPELVYSSQGARRKNSVYGDFDNLELQYLNLPLLIQYRFNNGLNLQAGPQFGYLLNSTTLNTTMEDSNSNHSSVLIIPVHRSIDVGISIGASWVHASTGLGIDARYNMGLNSIFEEGNYPMEPRKNRGFQIGLFYLFKYSH